MTVKLDVQKRTESAQNSRTQGNVPGIVYGPKQEPVAISVPKIVLEKMVHEAGESTIISLEGLGESIDVLIHDVSFNPKVGGVEHIDFYAIERGKDVSANVPLHFEGEAPAVKLGGSLTKVMHDIEVTCKPSLLPSFIEVDVSSLVDFEAQIKVKDLVVPTGVTLGADEDEVVALVAEVKEEVEDTEEIDIADIPVVDQKEKEESPDEKE